MSATGISQKSQDVKAKFGKSDKRTMQNAGKNILAGSKGASAIG